MTEQELKDGLKKKVRALSTKLIHEKWEAGEALIEEFVEELLKSKNLGVRQGN